MIYLLIPTLALFMYRLLNLSVRFSDGNIYFYTAYELLRGKMLYSNIFFTNLPLFPYIAAVYEWASGANILFFNFTATIEVLIVTFLIYNIVRREGNGALLSFFSGVVYLLSFVTLSTSDFQTGVFVASIIAILAYKYKDQHPGISGILTALMLLTKAYFLPVALAYMAEKLVKTEYKKLSTFSQGLFIPIVIICSTFFLLTKGAVQFDIVSYSLARSQGISKINIIWFYISHDPLLFLLLFANLFFIKARPFFGFLSIFGILFFFLYKDSYYLYLNFLTPFLALSLPFYVESLNKKLHLQKLVIPSLIAVLLAINIIIYLSHYSTLGKVTNLEEIEQAIKAQHPKVLYGTNDITPALSYLTSTPLLDDIVDTNENIFIKGIYNAHKLTSDAINQHALLIAHGAYYPQYGIIQPIIDRIFDKNLVAKNCKQVASFPIYVEGINNRLNLFKCL